MSLREDCTIVMLYERYESKELFTMLKNEIIIEAPTRLLLVLTSI